MKTIWDIKLYEYAEGGYAVRIAGGGQIVKRKGQTPYEAYRNAEMQFIFQPAFFINPKRKAND